MEFGPRALGNRSILADPRPADMQERLNLKIKFRESFRPFAPAVLRERTGDYFDLHEPSPYMLLVAQVNAGMQRHDAGDASSRGFAQRLKETRSTVPAVTHVDYSARVQTVDAQQHSRFHRLLQEFEKRTGCPVLVNTSFNVRSEPPVCTPEDAFRCFMKTGIDYLVLGNFLVDKRQQKAPPPEKTRPAENWINREYEKMDRSPRSLRRFGLTIGTLFLVLAVVSFFRHRMAGWPLATFAGLVLTAAEFAPARLRLLHRIWTKGSLVIGWVMTRVILTLLFFLAVTPIGLLQRLFGKRSFHVTFPGSERSYWQARDPDIDPLDYEKQF